MGDFVWMAVSSTLPPTWDSSRSKRLNLVLCCSTMASGTIKASWRRLTWAGGRWLKSPAGTFGDWGWLKTSKSSSKSETSTTCSSSLIASWKGVASSSAVY